jgi:hypothetical protein
MSVCGGITQSILLNCATPPVSGTADKLYLINRSDIASTVFNTTGLGSHKIIESITLNSGASAFYVEGRNNSNEPNQSLKKGRYFDSYVHGLRFKPFDNAAYVKDQIELMVQRGDLVAIVENNFGGSAGNSKFEAYGYDGGLEVMEAGRNPLDQDTQGAYDILLQTPEESGEPHLPYSVFITDTATTRAMLEGLLS